MPLPFRPRSSTWGAPRGWTVGRVLAQLLAVAGCQGEIEALGPALETYFPRRVGAYREYEVIDSSFTTGGWRVRTYRLRETGTATLTDQGGRPQLRLAIDTASSGLPLTEETTHWHTLTPEFAERLEGADRVLVLAHPIAPDRRWNGNRYNTRGEETFAYTDLDTLVQLPMTGGGLRRFEACVRVQQREGLRRTSTGDERLEAWELFAPGVGRIVRVDRRLRTDLTGQLVPDGSRVIRLTLTDTNY